LHRIKTVARTTKKRAKQLKHDKFRDTTFDMYGRLSHRVEGRERTIIYAAAGVVALVALLLAFNWWRGRQAEAASAALGKAIEIAETPVASGTPAPGDTGPTFANEKERAQKAVEAFQKVQHDYGSPYSELARYFAATSLLSLDRPKGLSELEALTKNGDADVSARSKFARSGGRALSGASRRQEPLGLREHAQAPSRRGLREAGQARRGRQPPLPDGRSLAEGAGQGRQAADTLGRHARGLRQASGAKPRALRTTHARTSPRGRPTSVLSRVQKSECGVMNKRQAVFTYHSAL
jgi:hypothetical protein